MGFGGGGGQELELEGFGVSKVLHNTESLFCQRFQSNLFVLGDPESLHFLGPRLHALSIQSVK